MKGLGRKVSYLTLAVLVLAFSSKGFADDGDYASKMTDTMKQQLSLSDDQAKQIQDIVNKYRTTTDNSSNTASQDREDYFKQKRAQREQMQNEINSVLTDAQRQKWQEVRQQRHGGWQNGTSGRHHGGRHHHGYSEGTGSDGQ